jgi:hypothetical protein
VNRSHLWIPDTQIKPGVPLQHLTWISRFALDEGPTNIVIAGDWWDFPSLSKYDKAGSKSAEGRRVRADIDAGRYALELLLDPWDKAGWVPQIDFLFGNHCFRWNLAINDMPAILDGLVPDPFEFMRERGIRTHKFLELVDIDDIRYSHLVPHNSRGQVLQNKKGASSALHQLRSQLMSTTAGHCQGLDIAIMPTKDGMRRGLIAGSCYLHDEEYVGPLNHYWRGCVLKRNIRDHGDYDLCEASLDWLQKRYRRYEPKVRLTA